ncbi:MAG: polyprenyl synthetase family protein [Candidatus Bathyarchaeia archaeon]
MDSGSELMETAKGIIIKRGRDAIEKAAEEILISQHYSGVVSSALKYFARVTLRGALPVFPALMSLSCEAVGGKTEKTTKIGAAMELISSAADIHDDIIDQSTTKYFKKTVFGKFGGDVALLAGDALLVLGTNILCRECESFRGKQRKAILSLMVEALFKISNAEAKETRLKRKNCVTPEEYIKVIRLKAVVPELYCKIGGILGNADEEIVDKIGRYGRTFGVVSAIREEFIDLLEYPELQNRIINECLPLPMLCAFQDSKIRNEIAPIIKSSNLSKKDARRLVKTVLGSMEVEELKKKAQLMISEEIKRINFIQEYKLRNEATLLLQALTEGL